MADRKGRCYDFAHTVHMRLSLQTLSRYACGLSAGLVIVVGVVLRLHHYGRDLSIAEAWVANSVLTKSLHDMFYYDSWLQTTPPLFLVLVRTAVRLFGLSNYSLCAVPLAFSVLALLLLAVLAGRMLRRPFALICLSLTALSPPAIAYSKELKQYSADMAASTLMLLALWEYLRKHDSRHYLWLLLALALTLTLSYPVVVLVPLVLCVLVFGLPTGRSVPSRRTIVFRCALLLLLVVTMSCLNYFLFIRPNTAPQLQEFWSVGYPPLSGKAAMVDFFAQHFLVTPVYFYVPLQFASKDAVSTMLLSLPRYVKLMGIFMGLIWLTFLIRAFRRERFFQWAMLFFLIPLLTLMAMNWARLYPVSSRRLTLFFLPCVVVATAASLQVLWPTAVIQRIQWGRTAGLLLCPLVAIATGLLALGIRTAGWDVDASGDRGTESALRYLKSQVNTQRDTIYVQAALDEPARLYLRMLGWDDAPVRTGHTGWPCCKRTVELRPTDVEQERAYVLTEFDNVIGQRTKGYLWLAFWEQTRGPWLARIKVDEPDAIIDHLHKIGCRGEFEQHFESVVVDKFQCNSSEAAPSGTNPARNW